MKKRAKRRRQLVHPHVDRLYKAVQNYVEHYGGSVVVVGGVQLQKWPQDNEYVFHISVKCCGREPTLKPHI